MVGDNDALAHFLEDDMGTFAWTVIPSLTSQSVHRFTGSHIAAPRVV
jgi:hypothetical protein